MNIEHTVLREFVPIVERCRRERRCTAIGARSRRERCRMACCVGLSTAAPTSAVRTAGVVLHLLAMLHPMHPTQNLLSPVDERFLSTLYVQGETRDGRLAQNAPCRKRALVSHRLLLSSRMFHRLRLRFASPPNTALVRRLSGGGVDSSSEIDLEFGSGGGSEGDEAGESDQGVRRTGKGGIGRGKAGVGPLTSARAQEKGRADDAREKT